MKKPANSKKNSKIKIVLKQSNLDLRLKSFFEEENGKCLAKAREISRKIEFSRYFESMENTNFKPQVSCFFSRSFSNQMKIQSIKKTFIGWYFSTKIYSNCQIIDHC